jgi:hypothetical protein
MEHETWNDESLFPCAWSYRLAFCFHFPHNDVRRKSFVASWFGAWCCRGGVTYSVIAISGPGARHLHRARYDDSNMSLESHLNSNQGFKLFQLVSLSASPSPFAGLIRLINHDFKPFRERNGYTHESIHRISNKPKKVLVPEMRQMSQEMCKVKGVLQTYMTSPTVVLSAKTTEPSRRRGSTNCSAGKARDVHASSVSYGGTVSILQVDMTLPSRKSRSTVLGNKSSFCNISNRSPSCGWIHSSTSGPASAQIFLALATLPESFSIVSTPYASRFCLEAFWLTARAM